MDFKSIRYVLATAERGRVSEAAKDLGISQPSLSKYLQNLQDSMGIQFFSRVEGELTPTYAGERYLEAGRMMLDVAKDLEVLCPEKNPEQAGSPGKPKLTLDLRHLRYLVAVARERNISRASEKLYIAQSALSQSIIRMEERAGVPLFKRLQHGLSPTVRGEEIIRIAEKILKIKEDMDKYLGLIRNGYEDRILFGISHTFSESLLPKALSDFYQTCPNTEIIVHTETSSVLQQMLLNASLDAAVMVESGKRDPQLTYEILFYEQILLAISPENPVVKSAVLRDTDSFPFVDPALLHDQHFILSENNMRLRQSAEAFFAAEGIKPIVTVVTANIETANRLAAMGPGIAFLPASFVETTSTPPLPRYFGTSKSLEDWKVCIVLRNDRLHDPLIQNFTKIFKDSI
jgi:DNA-binding transcriptional LysR family regulator